MQFRNQCPPIQLPNGKLANHPDFEAGGNGGILTGLVQKRLGSDRKPVWGGANSANPADSNSNIQIAMKNFIRSSNYDFQDWFRDSYRNKRVDALFLTLTPNPAAGANSYQINNQHFFPLDPFRFQGSSLQGPIWPLAPYETNCQSANCFASGIIGQGQAHKFSFCTEHHSYFNYTGTESFNFVGGK